MAGKGPDHNRRRQRMRQIIIRENTLSSQPAERLCFSSTGPFICLIDPLLVEGTLCNVLPTNRSPSPKCDSGRSRYNIPTIYRRNCLLI